MDTLPTPPPPPGPPGGPDAAAPTPGPTATPVSLPPAARTRWRVQGGLVGAVLGTVAGAMPAALLALVVGPAAAVLVGVGLLAGVAVGVVWANRRHRRFRYVLDDERLRVVDGVVVHSDAVAPLFRVQHVDLTRGPLQLAFGLATLAVHTASPAADVRLPDLRADDAEQIRDRILTASKKAAAAVGTADADAV